MGSDAYPAVPAVLKKFQQVDSEQQRELLTLVASVGPSAKQSVSIIEQAMTREDISVRLSAACAMLCVVPANKKAAALLKSAFLNKDKVVAKGAFVVGEKEIRSLALEACVEIGPQSKALVGDLISLLGDSDESIRILATHTLGRMGSNAIEAIPAIEGLLMKEDDHMKHTFVSHRTAAFALREIGKPSVPALMRATEKSSGGRRDAIHALGRLGQDAAAAVEPLINIVKDKKDPDRAAAVIALGSLGEHARSARQVLELNRKDSDQMHVAVQWAVMQIPK